MSSVVVFSVFACLWICVCAKTSKNTIIYSEFFIDILRRVLFCVADVLAKKNGVLRLC